MDPVPDNNIVVSGASGKIDSGADFAAVQGCLPGNIADVFGNVTESGMVSYSGATSLTIRSGDPGTVRTISAGAAMVEGNGAFFAQTEVGKTLSLNLADLKFTGGTGATDDYGDSDGGAIFSAGGLNIEGSAVTFANNTAEYGGALGAYNRLVANVDMTLAGNFAFVNNAAKVYGGALYTAGVLQVSGTNLFTGNGADEFGGAIYSYDDAYIRGTNMFSGNSAGEKGGAIYADDKLYLGGANAFSGNAAGEDGGAVYADFNAFVSGTNTFSRNAAGENGGAIYANFDVTVIGTNTFSRNAAGENGGAIYADDNLYLVGDGSKATFIGNTIGANTDGGTPNDVYVAQTNDAPGKSYGVHISGAGEYYFGGGIDASHQGLKLEISDGANVTFGERSLTDVGGVASLSGSIVTIQGGTATRVVVDQATSVGSLLNFEHSIAQAGRVFDTAKVSYADSLPIVTLTDEGTSAIGYVSRFDETGIVTSVKDDDQVGTYNRVRGFSFVSSANTLNGLAGQDGDILIATADGQATGTQAFSGDTLLTVQSNSTDERLISAGSGMTAGHGAFFAQTDDAKTLSLNLSNVMFTGGTGATDADGDSDGGAVFSAGNMDLVGKNVTFAGNSAQFGGALGAFNRNEDNEDNNLSLVGVFTFANNFADEDGGAIFAEHSASIVGTNLFIHNVAGDGYGGAIAADDEVIIRGTNAFIGNEANFGGAIASNSVTVSGTNQFVQNASAHDGGAIKAKNVVFSGFGSVGLFENNFVGSDDDGWTPNDIDAANVTIKDEGTYFFGGGIRADSLSIGSAVSGDGDPTVTFGEHSTTAIDGGTLSVQNATLGFEIGSPTVHEETPYIDATDATVNLSNVKSKFAATESYDGKGTANVVLVEADGGTDLSALQSNDQPYIDNNLWTVTTSLRTDTITGASQYVANVAGKDPGSRFGNGYAAMDLYTNEFYNNDYSDSELRAHINGATGELFASAATAQVERINYINRKLANRLAMEDLPSPHANGALRGQNNGCCSGRNVWVSGYGMDGAVNMHNSFSGYGYNVGGSLFGLDWSGDCAQAGFYYGYGQTTMAAAASNLKSKDHTFGAYANWENEHGYTSLMGGFSFSSADAWRHDLTGPSAGDYDSWQADVYWERGIRLQNEAGLVLNPYFALQYISYGADSFDIGALNVGNVDFNSFRTILGIRLSKSVCTQWGMVQLSTGFSWNHELLDADATFIGSTILPAIRPRSTTVVGNGAGRDYCELTLGAGVDLNKRINVSGDYYLMFNRYSTVNAGMGTLTVKF